VPKKVTFLKRFTGLGFFVALALASLNGCKQNVPASDSSFSARTSITRLRTCFLSEPTGLDETPSFTWEMESNVVGMKQASFKVSILDAEQTVVWESGTIFSNQENFVPSYAFSPCTSYYWQVEVTDMNHQLYRSSLASFSTGFRSTSLSSLGADAASASFIGSSQISLESSRAKDYVLSVSFSNESSSSFSLLFGAEDYRLSKAFYNDELLEAPNCHYEVNVDVSSLESGAVVSLLRHDYSNADRVNPGENTILFASRLSQEQFPCSDPQGEHNLTLSVKNGSAHALYFDGTNLLSSVLSLNPLGSGSNYRIYPCLNKIGFSSTGTTNWKGLYVYSSVDSSKILFGPQTGKKYTDFSALSGFSVSGDTIRTVAASGVIDPSFGSLSYLRREFALPSGGLKEATLYATAHGIYESYLNGKKINRQSAYYNDSQGSVYQDDYFNPGNTDYRETIRYSAYDVTSYLSSGDNVLGAVVAPGWWSGAANWEGNTAFYGLTPGFWGLLRCEMEDGSIFSINTNTEQWKCNVNGAVQSASFYDGETYDARKEKDLAGCFNPGFNDGAWDPCVISAPREKAAKDPMFVGMVESSVHVAKILEGHYLGPVNRGTGTAFLFDMGQEMVGIPSLRLPFLPSGEKMILRYGEQLYPEKTGGQTADYGNLAGLLYTDNYRSAQATDIYIGSGEAVSFSPSLTYRGYRYVEISFSSLGVAEAQNLISKAVLRGLFLSSLDTVASTYTSNNAQANQLFQNIVTSTLGNSLSLPTDCSQRDERFGWTGDTGVFLRASTYLSTSYGFLYNYLALLLDQQKYSANGNFGNFAPGYVTSLADYSSKEVGDPFIWPSVGIRLPYEIYLASGDTSAIEQGWEGMEKFLASYLNNVMVGHTYLIEDKEGHSSNDFGDWLSEEETDKTYLTNCYYAYCLQLMANMAQITKREERYSYYSSLANHVRRRKEFFHSVNGFRGPLSLS
jgi:alpha-L-rhamnosidase